MLALEPPESPDVPVLPLSAELLDDESLDDESLEDESLEEDSLAGALPLPA
ncbi:MAG: hypothetical protein JWM90_2369 [Thermoleophilia bacterium]|nr:hypothetical protein [Thermoleophilia bacterium]